MDDMGGSGIEHIWIQDLGNGSPDMISSNLTVFEFLDLGFSNTNLECPVSVYGLHGL